MKIAYFNYLYDSNQDSVGASVHVKQFAEAAARCGHEVKTFHLNRMPQSNGGAGTWSSRMRNRLKPHLKRYVGQVNQLLKNVPLFFREWRILAQEKPDVLLVRYNLLNFTAPLVARLQKIPVVLEVNSPHAFERKHLTNDVWQIPLIPFWTERLTFKLADRVVTVSEALRRYYLDQKISDDKIFVVPNGVDIERFNPETSGDAVRKRYGLEGKVVVGFVGSFHYWHGVENILYLIERTKERNGEVAYLLVGDGPLRSETEQAVREQGRSRNVVFTGYVKHEKIPAHLAAMDIVLAPYPAMDFFYFSPLKLFEYLAAGKAVVASDIGQISELVRDGDNGFLYDPRNLDELVRKVETLIERPELRERFGRRGRATIEKNYTWENNAKRILKIALGTNGRTATGIN